MTPVMAVQIVDDMLLECVLPQSRKAFLEGVEELNTLRSSDEISVV